MNISIPLHDLHNVLPFRASGDPRTYLDGILVEPHPEGGALLVATDGRILGAYHSKETVATERRVLRIGETLSRIITPRAMPDDYDGEDYFDPDYVHNGYLTLLNNRLTVTDSIGNEEHIQAGDAFINAKRKDGPEHYYPDWRAVVPPVSALERGAINSYAAHFIGVIDRVRPDSRKSVLMWRDRRSEKGAAVMQVYLIPGLVIVLMPTSDHEPEPWPTWMAAENVTA